MCKSNSGFQCDNGQCVSKDLVCDGDIACMDSSDEKNCKCFASDFVCPTGECLDVENLCDSRKDCKDGTDEARCGKQQIQKSSFISWNICYFRVSLIYRAKLLGRCFFLRWRWLRTMVFHVRWRKELRRRNG